jgi:ABC-type uncharacterized transport system permease subunit
VTIMLNYIAVNFWDMRCAHSFDGPGGQRASRPRAAPIPVPSSSATRFHADQMLRLRGRRPGFDGKTRRFELKAVG